MKRLLTLRARCLSASAFRNGGVIQGSGRPRSEQFTVYDKFMKLALDQKPINQTTHDKRGSFDDKILEYTVHYRDYYKVLRLNFATKKEKNIKVIVTILKKLIKKSDKSSDFSIVKLNGHHFLRYRSVRELLKLDTSRKILIVTKY